MKTHIPVYLSGYNWQPGMDGSLFAWSKGEVVTFKAPSSGKEYQVRVDSEIRHHTESPTGFCYECVFLDGSGRWALDPTYFSPFGEHLDKIQSGRAELGLPVDGTGK